jgi:integrase
MQSEQQRGEWVDPRESKILVADYVTEWLKGRRLRPSTHTRYQGLLDRYILPKFGALELGDVTTRAVRAWNAEIRTDHPDTAAQAYRLLATIYNTAVADDLIARSPCKVKGASLHKNPERPVATVEEIAAATEAMAETYRLAVLLACYCQLRRGEVLGLQRKHIDVDNSVLRVEQAWTVSGGQMHLGPPKTDAGLGTVDIPPNVLPILGDHLERFAGPGPDGCLFPGNDGSVISPRTLDRQWTLAREAIGRPDLHFHDLRHCGLTMVAMTGATTAEIMAAGRHASQTAAIRYQHATPHRMKAIADALAAMSEGRMEPPSPKKGHAGGTTPSGDVSDQGASESAVAASEGSKPTLHARRHRHRRRKSPGEGPNSEGQESSAQRLDVDPHEPSASANSEQPQRDSNPCRHLERVVSSATRRWGPAPFRAESAYPIGRDPLSASTEVPRHTATHAHPEGGHHPWIPRGSGTDVSGVEPITHPGPTAVGPGEENWLGGEDSNPQ